MSLMNIHPIAQEIAQEFWRGCKLAAFSLSLVFSWPMLLAYLSIPFALATIVLWCMPPMVIIPYMIINPIVVTVASIGLIYHLHYVLQNNQQSLVDIALKLPGKLQTCVAWGAIASVVMGCVLFVLFLPISHVMQALIVHGTTVLFIMLSSFVLTVIAYEQKNLIATIRHAGRLLRLYWWEVLGGNLVLYALFLIPLLLSFCYFTLVPFLVTLNMILVNTATIVFSTLIYRRHQREALQEFILDSRMGMLP